MATQEELDQKAYKIAEYTFTNYGRVAGIFIHMGFNPEDSKKMATMSLVALGVAALAAAVGYAA